MDEPIDQRQTTMRVFWADLVWLQERQRRVSFRENKTVTMPELIHDFVRAIKEWEAGEGA